jgi:serine/threonine protein kinase
VRVVGNKVRLERKIGSGGMGDVWRGKHLVTGAEVAVKVLEPSTHPDEDAAERFRTEAHVSALLAHPSIVRVFDLFEEKDGTLALVMELLVGRTLDERLSRDGPLEPDVAVAIGAPILGALDHAHAVGVIHRDVKPGNVFLHVEPDGRVTPKLLDFGVAKSAASKVQTMDGRILGTSRYVSPEQARGETLDGRSDLFSMAVVLYEAMTGESPFAARDAARALENVIERVVDAHERIPPRVWLVLQKSLAKQAYARYASASAMADALVGATGKDADELARLLRDERPPLPRLETPIVAIHTARSRPARRRLWPIAAFAAGAAAIAATFLLARDRAAPPLTPASQPAATSAAPAPPPPPETAVTAQPAPSATLQPPGHARPVRRVPPRAPAHAKPVATTPGF